jgi:hypothetical protein
MILLGFDPAETLNETSWREKFDEIRFIPANNRINGFVLLFQNDTVCCLFYDK